VRVLSATSTQARGCWPELLKPGHSGRRIRPLPGHPCCPKWGDLGHPQRALRDTGRCAPCLRPFGSWPGLLALPSGPRSLSAGNPFDEVAIPQAVEDILHRVLGGDARQLTADLIGDVGMVGEILYDGVLCGRKALMSDVNDNRIAALLNLRIAEPKAPHGGESSIQALAHVLVRRVWKLVDESNNHPVPGEALSQDVCGRDVRRKRAWALYLDAVVEDANVHVVRVTVVSVQHRVRDDLVQVSVGYSTRSKPVGPRRRISLMITFVCSTARWIAA